MLLVVSSTASDVATLYPELGVFLGKFGLLGAFTAFVRTAIAKTTSALLLIMSSRILLLLALPGASPA